MSDSVQPQRRQPTRLPRPGKNTGVGCHFLLHVCAYMCINYKEIHENDMYQINGCDYLCSQRNETCFGKVLIYTVSPVLDIFF